MSLDIATEYDDLLKKHYLGSLRPVASDYTGLFLPAIPRELGDKRVMLVGKETRQWNGTLERWFESSAEGRTRAYIDRAINGYLETRCMPPSKYRFLQFLRQSEQTLSLPKHTLHWANLFAAAFRRGSPQNRPESELKPLLALSYDLLAVQIQTLEPDAILFTTGPTYDPFIKQFSQRFGGYETVKIHEPRRLWEFRLGDIRCFRTTHPRYAAGRTTRGLALKQIDAL
ncbi:hypothetical protein [Salinicola aestuarinus]|uniref:hypothetical protein n=1 Tax=Salinicola aestuarinus TaxID=1949082 RepID=UPI000DA141AD|nr:hypothetical protein [Salinicola aestuarinus]